MAVAARTVGGQARQPETIPANPGKVTAEFKDGVLTVHLAKVAMAKPQQVEINVS